MFLLNKMGFNLYAEEVDLNMFRRCGKPSCLAAFSIPFSALYVTPFWLPPPKNKINKLIVILSDTWKFKIYQDNKN